MCKAIIVLTIFLAASTHCEEDAFTRLEKRLTNTLAYHYLWPWNQLFKVATSFEEDPQTSSDPQITENPETFVVKLNVRNFKPENLNVTVKQRYIIVEGKCENRDNDNPKLLHNHFIMRFIIPSECKPEEVTATWEDNFLYLRAPKYDLPPPLPDRTVPIEIKSKNPTRIFMFNTTSTTTTPLSTEVTTKDEKERREQEPPAINPYLSSISPDIEDVEVTTRAGKIRKKELKVTKTAKDNEVKKGTETNNLDYALIEGDE